MATMLFFPTPVIAGIVPTLKLLIFNVIISGMLQAVATP